MKILSRQIIVSYLPKIILFLLTPIIIKILTNYLTVQEYGYLSVINSLGNYLFFIAGFGIPRFLAKVLPGQSVDKQYQTFNSYTIIELCVFFALFVLIVIFSKPLFLLLHLEQFSSYIIIFLLVYVFYILYNELMRFYGLQKRLELKSYLAIIEKPLFLVLLLILIVGKNNVSIKNILKSYFILYPILFGVAFVFFQKKYLSNIKINLSLFGANLPLLFPFFFIDLFYKTKDILPKYLLSGYYSGKIIGLYAFGDNYARLIFILTNSFVFILYPYIAESYNRFKKHGNRKENLKFITYIQTSFHFSLYIFTIGFLLAFFFRVYFIKLLGNAQYLNIQNKIWLFLMNYFLLTLISLFQPIVILTKPRKILLPLYLTAFVVNIFLSVFMVRWIGLLGAVLSVFITNFLLLIFSLVFLKDIIKQLFSFFFFLKYLLFLVILFGLFLLIQRISMLDIFRVGIGIIGSAILLWFFLKHDIEFVLRTKVRM